MIPVAISSCLLGNSVRYDGSHKKDAFLVDALGKFCTYTPFCPEHIAYGTPRQTIRLQQHHESIDVVASQHPENILTSALNSANSLEIERLKSIPLCGIILKSKSPSCGLGSAKYYLESGMAEGKKDGLFAALCKEHFPLLPIEEEGRLQDAWLRENFIMQLFAYYDLQAFLASCTTFGQLVTFHTAYKYLLFSKDEQRYREMGRLVGNQNKKELPALLCEYAQLFKECIAIKSSIKKTRNVLEHMLGFFKKELTKVEKEIIKGMIADFTEKIVPLITPLYTLRMLAHKYSVTYLLEQKFLSPYPDELALRSDIKSGK